MTKAVEDVTYIGGEAPYLLFEMQYHALHSVVESHKGEVGNGPLQYPVNPGAEIAFIGLIAQFEAFCKHQFAALINCNQQLLHQFAKTRPQSSVRLDRLAMLANGEMNNVGAVVAEQFDFGPAKSVNRLFHDLVGVTPFSKDESRLFDSALLKRNLLVHHGGIYTLDWLKKGSDAAKAVGDFGSRLHFSTEQYHQKSDFIFEMAIKLTKTTVTAAMRCDKRAEQQLSYNRLLQGLYDSLAEHP